MNTAILMLGIFALLIALILYFVFLPHIEGPNVDDQRADQKAWLVNCPNCHRWEPHTPISTTENDLIAKREQTFSNWYHCLHCGHRWREDYQ